MSPRSEVTSDLLRVDPESVVQGIEAAISEMVFKRLKRRGVVVGLSGGIDSSLVASLCARALGSDRVLGLLMPEVESSGESLRLGQLVATELGIETIQEEITPILNAVGCYQRRDEAIRKVVPNYEPGSRCKLVLPDLLTLSGFRLPSVVVQLPSGDEIKARLTPEAYRSIVAATNFKQRVRKMLEYHHADRLGYAVAGTPNRLEHDQGFFVKNGDGAADLKPIAHLYKTQVYQVAEYLKIPLEIQQRPPTTDTYPLEQTQEEFYFSVSYDKLDLCLYAKNHQLAATDIAEAAGLTVEQVERVFRDIESKRNTTRYLHLSPLLVEDVDEV